MEKPSRKPKNPNFSSGPCAKRPGWSVDCLNNALTGRSHRSAPGKTRLQKIIDLHRELLAIPADYHIGIVPASDTGAIEMAMWSMLGVRPIDVLAWESFGSDWQKDITDHLKLEANVYEADYGFLPDLSKVNSDNDIVFTWNGTTSGVRVPDAGWIARERKGLSFCDATSAVFAYDIPWDRLDVTTWSWQKCLGGEAGHGMLVLSPRAVARLENYKPDRPLPKIFRLTQKGKLNEGIFEGMTINTPSMLAVEDCLDALNWVKSIGGLKQTIKRSQANLAALEKWVGKTPWIGFLAEDPAIRSVTSICLKITDPWFEALSDDEKGAFISTLCKLLDREDVARDIKGYKNAPPGLRIWGGATIETADIEALLPWLEWAFEVCKSEQEEKEIN
ncbi:MAG: phosphoserine transaminase [Alphaproteobacteria bacterium CG_4_9_14_3_um_filter_47_13]|nr:MAG: phosphoserine transaminase [Alphaproteobacteria bacterium CG_4_9_14_3_um_filter_47_13]